jgi:hypothetical protein
MNQRRSGLAVQSVARPWWHEASTRAACKPAEDVKSPCNAAMGSVLAVGLAFSPLDEVLALEGGGLTPHAKARLVRLGTWMPFRQAADLLADLTGAEGAGRADPA